jgi:S1-C subfamily serine protease
MSRAVLALITSALIAILGVRPVSAQSAATAAAEDLLQSIVARITVRTPMGEGLCHGFVATVRGDTAYIVTAKHCLESLSPATVQRQQRDPDLAITVAYANGGTGSDRHVYWHLGSDDLVIVASFDSRPATYADLCPSCRSYRTLAPTSQPIPVLSMLSSAGGLPVLSTGMLLVTATGTWIVLLPTAPGTSGAPVIDLRGNLVGVVSSATVVRGTQAGVMVELVPGAIATDLVRSAIAKVEGASTALPASPTPAQAPGDGAGYVIRVSTDQTAFVVVLDRSGQSVHLSSSSPCEGIREYDRVSLRISNGSATLTSADATCAVLVMDTPRW